MQKITPFLWFNDNAEEAMNFYTAVLVSGVMERQAREKKEPL